MRGNRATVKDVAELAQVSMSTVSRVINGNYPVKKETKKKVDQAIRQLDFKPNLLARSLILDSSQTIGIVVPSIENLFFAEVVKGIDEGLLDAQYRSFLCHTNGRPEVERAMVDSLISRNVDGIIVVDATYENAAGGYLEAISQKVPLVLINGYVETVGCNYVYNDDYPGMMQAIQYLRAKKYHKIGFLVGKNSISYDFKEKIFKQEVGEERIFRIDSGNTIEAVKDSKQAVVQQLTAGRIDALICGNDFMAVGALNAAHQLNQSIGIVGFDNTIISQITIPSLTTVDHNMKQLGNIGAERLLRLMQSIKNDRLVQRISIPTTLIIRET